MSGREYKPQSWESQKAVIASWLAFKDVKLEGWEAKVDAAKAEVEKVSELGRDNLNCAKVVIVDKYVFAIDRNNYHKNCTIEFAERKGKEAEVLKIGNFKIRNLSEEQIVDVVKIVAGPLRNEYNYRDDERIWTYDEIIGRARTKLSNSGVVCELEAFENYQEPYRLVFPSTEFDLEPPKNKFLSKVAFVYEGKNERYVGFIRQSNSDYGKNSEVVVMSFTPDSPVYNYLDKGRILFWPWRNEGSMCFFWDDLSEDVVDEAYLRKMNVSGLITAEQYKQAVRKFELKVMQERKEAELKNEMLKSIEKKFKGGSENFKTFTHSGITFSKHLFEYAGQKIGFVENPIEDRTMLPFYETVKFDAERIDFNELFLSFVRHLINYHSDAGFRICVGDYTIKYESSKSTNDANLSYINDVRINNGEIRDVLERALCFETQADYDGFIKQISKCSLRFHELMASGLIVEVVPFGQSQWNKSKDWFTCRFNMKREKNRGYLYYFKDGDDGKKTEVKFAIKDTNKLLSVLGYNKSGNRYGAERVVKFTELGNYFTDALGIGPIEFNELLKDAVKEHVRVQKRSEELLEKAIKTLGVKKIEVKGQKGYLIKGQMSQYFVSGDGDGNHGGAAGKVYKYPSMAYVCMVEKTGVKRVGNDLIVNRLYALANDSVLVKEISTLS